MEFTHYSVMAAPVLELLAVDPAGIYIDGTVGGAGHACAIARRLTQGGRLYGFDRDPDAVAVASERLAGLPAEVIHRNFDEMAEAMAARHIQAVDGVLLDLGVSSYQLDEPERGFSYHGDAPLDMRMSRCGMTAAELVNTAEEAELARILYVYGEEKFSRRIAADIVRARAQKPFETTAELAAVIAGAFPAKIRREKNPCKKSFQAIRIAVNGELEHLERGLGAAFSLLRSGGRLCVITFHSLEDRIVKQQFAAWCRGCICPPDFPQCVCGHKPEGQLVNRKPIVPDAQELAENSRSHSAKLRAIEKL